MNVIKIEELYKWIDTHPISRQKKCIHRDFSDAMPLVEILKVYYPNLVELHNYSPKNAVKLKCANWETLNRKVLAKIKSPLDEETMKKLSESTPGVIEKVLYDVKTKVEEHKRKNSNGELLTLDGLSQPSDSIVNVKVKNGAKVTMQKMIPSEIYDKMQHDLAEQDQLIIMLNSKIQHLEALVTIKDERIKDLTNQLDRFQTSKAEGDNICNRFFKHKRNF